MYVLLHLYHPKHDINWVKDKWMLNGDRSTRWTLGECFVNARKNRKVERLKNSLYPSPPPTKKK